jgi:hypothetical protein
VKPFREYLRYVFHNLVLPKPKVTFFPKGGSYVCGHGQNCNRTFPTYYARNFHEWKEHPGCPRFRKATFWDWLRDDDRYHHSCRCQQASECTHGCWKSGSPFRNG